jgi:hypothetical protein
VFLVFVNVGYFYFSLFCISLVVFLSVFSVSNALETFFFSISMNLEYGAIESWILSSLLCISLWMSFKTTVSIWDCNVNILLEKSALQKKEKEGGKEEKEEKRTKKDN